MPKSFLELIKGDEPVFYINFLAGLGDAVSNIARMESLQQLHPNHRIVWMLGGFGKSPMLMKELIEREGYIATIIKNYNFHNQHETMEEFILKNYVKKDRGDLYESWSFCREIFNNEDPPFLKYEMKFPYYFKTNTTAADINGFDEFSNLNTAIIKPFTTEGNPEGFEHDIEHNRFWSSEKWVDLCELLSADSITPVFVGLEKDLQDVPELCDQRKIKYLSFSGLSVEDTIFIINSADYCITTNSWEWGIAAKQGKPTVCNYLKNHFFLPVHVPQNNSPMWDNFYIETNYVDSDVATIKNESNNMNERTVIKGRNTATDIYRIFDYLVRNKKRPDTSYSVAMITLDDNDCVGDTLKNVIPYVVDDFVVVDGGSTDGTLNILKDNSSDIKLLEKKWDDNFEIQKNYALDNTNNDWRILIDADESFDHLLWNQIPWHIWAADQEGVDCISLPRINIVNDLTHEMVENQGWQLSFFNWINYPDYQERIYKKNCRYAGRTHERIVGSKNNSALIGQHIVHRKSFDRQARGIKRESDQYKLESKVVKKRINIASNKKLVLHYLHHLGIGGTAKVVQLLCKYFPKDDEFHHALAYKAHGELEREPFFEEYLGKDNLICFASGPELLYILKEINPFIMHRQTGGGPEFPFINPVDNFCKNLITTSIFGNVDESINQSKVIYISNHMQHCSGQFGPKIVNIAIPVEAPLTNKDLRDELDIPNDAFVFGRVGRDTNDINDPVNLEAFAQVEDNNTYFIALAPSDDLKEKAVELGVQNIRWVEPTLDDLRLSKFYNTMNVLAHARKDGECNPGNCWEAMAHGKPIISHYGIPYNGHIEEIGPAGFVVHRKNNFHNVWQSGNPGSIVDMLDYARSIGLENFTCEDSSGQIKNDIKEYARIMKNFINGTIDYDYHSKQAKDRWYNRARPEIIVNQHLELYRGL